MGKNSFVDRILALAAGVLVFVLLTVWSFPGLHPYAWNDVAVASGLLPQGDMLPGLGALVSHVVFSLLPFDTALTVDVYLAKAMVALCASMAFGIFSGMMAIVSGQGARDWRRRRLAIRIVAFVGAVVFACADPIWHAAQGVSASTLVIFLTVVTFGQLVRLLETAKSGAAILALGAAGLLCAETPLGWLALGLGLLLTFRHLAQPQSEEWKDFLDPVRMQRAKWSMTFLFIGAFLVGVLLEAVAFARLGGMRAAGVSCGDMPVRYAAAYMNLVVSAMDVPGLILFLLAAVVPFALSSALANPATDEDRYLSFGFSVVSFVTGAVAFLQLSPFEFAWFWSLVPDCVVSRQTLVFSSLLSAVTLVWALYVLGVEVLCRDYIHIENVMYQGDADELDDARGSREDVVSVRLGFGRLAMLVVPVLILAVVLPGRRLSEDRALLGEIRAFVDETLAESAGVKCLFTDGAFDPALRIEAKRRGIGLAPVSVLSGTSRRDACIRAFGSENFEDRLSLEAGATEALRTWVTAKPERLSEVAVQVAFELFRQNPRLTPVVYGLLVRPVGGDEKAAEESVERCRRLADRIVALHESGLWRHAKDASLKDLFLFAQFRLAVMARLRAIGLDARKKAMESLEEVACADRLDAHNPSLAKLLGRLDWMRRHTGEALTPREGLEVALKRADFVMARRYAMPILKEDADEPNANFAIGMSYYVEEQYARAEEYLKRVLRRSPREAAVYNNLALVCLKTGRLEEAERNAKKADELYPNSGEVKDTLNQIEKAGRERKRPARK